MQFKVDKNELKSALANVSKSIAPKADIKALEGVLIQLNQGELRLTGYDLTQGITTIIGAESMDSGNFIVQPKLLSGMINKMPSGDIDFLLDGNNMLTVQSKKTKFTLPILSAETYPTIPTLENSNEIEIEQDKLKSLINQTIFAVATNDTKPILTGELFEISNNQLNVVAIDGYRLAVRTEQLNTDDVNIVIPANALNKVRGLLNDTDKPCKIFHTNKYVTFQIGDYVLFSRLLEGQFHDYKKSIPKTNVTEVTLNCNEMIDCLERCSLLTNDRIKSPVKCIFKDGEISISLSTQLGKINDVISADIVGPQIEIGFNVKYLLDALKATEDTKIRFLMNGSNLPMTVKALQGDSFTFLVLPVRLKTNS